MPMPGLKPKWMALIKKYALAHPSEPATAFFKANPEVKCSGNTYTYHRRRFLTEAGRENEIPTGTTAGKKYNVGKKQSGMYTALWNIPVAEFEKDPVFAVMSFLRALNTDRRSDIELIKIEKDVEGKWVPHYEIRFS